MNVGELIRSIQKPISIYVNEIIQALHEKLHKDLHLVAKCSTPEDCNEKTKPRDLCKSCKSWFDKINDLHENSNNPKWRDKANNNPKWHKNCKSAEWPEDHWEVAKFFMSDLGSNLTTMKDAESTDISSLLNVLEWMKDGAFLGKTRVDVDLVRKLRSEVRNTWAHAPQQKLNDDEMAQSFSIAIDFLEDLVKIWSHAENGKCSECLEHLKKIETSGVTNVSESERQSLRLQHRLLNDIKEEITKIKDERLSDKSTLEEHEQKLKNLGRAIHECSQRMEKINEQQREERDITSSLPVKLPNFTARLAEIQRVISFLMNQEKAVVSLHGGPGFGKTAIAIEVSHRLSEDHNIPVFFSELTTATSVDEVIRQLCLDVAVNHEDKNLKSTLILWLRNIKSKVIFVMDDIENLLNDRPTFYEFVRLLRKNSNQACQIVTTSRSSYKIPKLATGDVNVEEMDVEACMELTKKQCPQQDDEFFRRLAELCGQIPLAMCIAGSRVDDFEDPDELIQHLQEQPMKTLECSYSKQSVYQAINTSYERCSEEEKEILVRLAVFDGNFGVDEVRDVIGKENSDIERVLKGLLSQSLIKQPTKHQYSINPLIKLFYNKKAKMK